MSIITKKEKPKKSKRIYFGGTEAEILQVFDDMDAMDLVFTHCFVSSDGFSYYTIDPKILGMKIVSIEDKTSADIAKSLAEALVQIHSSEEVEGKNKRKVWTLVLMTKNGESAIMAALTSVDDTVNYSSHRKSVSLKLN